MELSSRNEKETGLLSPAPTPALTPVFEEPSRSPTPLPDEVAVTSDNIDTPEAQDGNHGVRAPDEKLRNRASSLPARGPQLSTLNTFDGVSDGRPNRVLKLSPAQITKLTSSPGSLQFRAISPVPEELTPQESNVLELNSALKGKVQDDGAILGAKKQDIQSSAILDSPTPSPQKIEIAKPSNFLFEKVLQEPIAPSARPSVGSRSISVPFPIATRSSMTERNKPRRLHSKSTVGREEDKKSGAAGISATPPRPSLGSSSRQLRADILEQTPKPPPLQLPPLSIPTQLHLELSSERPPPRYATHPDSSRSPYEPSRVKFERLLNFLLLPPQLEQVLLFGALTCLDAWLYTFTILPLRFIKAVWLLIAWIFGSIWFEIKEMVAFVFGGIGRLWQRRRERSESRPSTADGQSDGASQALHSTIGDIRESSEKSSARKRQPFHTRLRASLDRNRPRINSPPSALQAHHKADILEGLLIICSCAVLMRFDASRIYHSIRGQAAMKLYVIYNVLEVFDRLFAALGQDIMECLFSAETLDRKPNGRSRIMRPLCMFLLALIYTVLHATAFFYQVITLNVAVNSYSNALLTLLMSNQFVEIKGTVFKKIEKENLFQLTCADVVERFQLWLMLLIIMLRNIVELGGMSASSPDQSGPASTGPAFTNSTTGVPFRTFGVLPASFTVLPSLPRLFPAHVLGPLLMVLGSEMLVDWLKHAYICKFNAMSHKVYSRYLDVLAKDHYSSAFAEQGLVRRLGLPVIPLTCLFIRASLQTYHMFLATTVSPLVPSTSTSLSTNTEATASPVIAQIDHIFRTALGRSTLGAASTSMYANSAWLNWTVDDAIALTTMLVVFLAIYLLLLVFKLTLGMALLRFSRDRFKGMKKREKASYLQTETKRLGGYGQVELGDERRKVIYEDDPVGLKAMRDREAKGKEGEGKEKRGDRLDEVDRYSMVAKRIW